MSKNLINYKFNNGNLVICCSKCSKIIKTGREFTEQEWKDVRKEHSELPAQYCDKCSLEILMKFIV